MIQHTMIQLGDVEEVVFKGMDGKRTVRANVDPGADRTSLDYLKASAIGAGPLVKTVTVRQASGRERRPVARMWVELRGFEDIVEVGLSDRKGMTHDAIIGKDILEREEFVVNL
ncbi:hypothetical protein [Natronoglomus mannanivorans]|uniref:RimK/LysX family protein n=1 Tax=Natronoglomus mannanivorans TaxID=2979990 RepID=A0AAP3E504_9EURY|nr:RimK/LysX family protein [Halobacteria archaeon AArc-xg1-1]